MEDQDLLSLLSDLLRQSFSPRAPAPLRSSSSVAPNLDPSSHPPLHSPSSSESPSPSPAAHAQPRSLTGSSGRRRSLRMAHVDDIKKTHLRELMSDTERCKSMIVEFDEAAHLKEKIEGAT
ncbi:hypothetical protein CASFOL_017187 [Castilleja foliolosa]|uniref:Uncharacterized protein n=1 Tax=Castilleja foliolosa TaxID=1961234 RepID=A0ABD3DEL2_9LAMI